MNEKNTPTTTAKTASVTAAAAATATATVPPTNCEITADNSYARSKRDGNRRIIAVAPYTVTILRHLQNGVAVDEVIAAAKAHCPTGKTEAWCGRFVRRLARYIRKGRVAFVDPRTPNMW